MDTPKKITLAFYNVQWMRDLFHKDGTPKSQNDPKADDTKKAEQNQKDAIRSEKLAKVVEAIDADVLCIAEGPTASKENPDFVNTQLENWRDHHGLCKDYRALLGFLSDGHQQICLLYKQSSVECRHEPEKINPFDKVFFVDPENSRIEEGHRHYRPPMEVIVSGKDDNRELLRLIVAHTKSRVVTDKVDFAGYMQMSERNQRKLFAECYSIRRRCDDWLREVENCKLAVLGDFNDEFGHDSYEERFSRSVVETLLGSVWEPQNILRSVIGRPKRNRYGWEPSSSRYRDRLTRDEINVLIDHILVSGNIEFDQDLIWNPHLAKAPKKVLDIKRALKGASDHFPISVQIKL